MHSGPGKNRTAIPTVGWMYQVFGVMSNELSTPKVLICGSDERNTHTNWAFGPGTTAIISVANTDNGYFCNNKISYFLGVDANDNFPQMFLAGDRNIYGTSPGLTALPATFPNNGYGNTSCSSYAEGTNFNANVVTPCWTDKMHQKNGNVLICDGSVQQWSSSKLRDCLRVTGDQTTLAGGNGTTGPNCLMFP